MKTKHLHRQSGVALIQVLLITFMLIILIIQLSRDAQIQVQLATDLKLKANLEREVFNSSERLKYALLTENKNMSTSTVIGTYWNFYSDEVKISDSITLSMQDEAGKLSLPYGGEELLLWLSKPELYKELRIYQGMEPNLNGIPNYRNGYMQGLAEINFVNGWDKDINENIISHLPTEFFNLYNAPRTLLSEVFPESYDVLLSYRSEGNVSLPDWQAVVGSQMGFILNRAPSKKLTVTFNAKLGNVEITRRKRLWLDSNHLEPIVEIMN